MSEIDKKNLIENPDNLSLGIEDGVGGDNTKQEQEDLLAIRENLKKSLDLTTDPKEAELIRKRLERLQKIQPETQSEEDDSTEAMITEVGILNAMQEKQLLDKAKSSGPAEELTRSLGMS